jgi:hypothetical protein
MTLKVDLTRREPAPLKVIDEDSGAEIRFTFKQILTRQQRMLMTKKVGKGRKAKEVPDMERMYRSTIESISGVEVVKDGETYGGDDTPITDREVIFGLMDTGLPEEVVEVVDEHILGMSNLGASEGNI